MACEVQFFKQKDMQSHKYSKLNIMDKKGPFSVASMTISECIFHKYIFNSNIVPKFLCLLTYSLYSK